MNETDTRAKLIDPMLRAAGWDENQIRREVVVGGRRVDYVLYDGGRVVAVVEAKAARRPAREGLAQAADYARRLGAPHAFATNGNQILSAHGTHGAFPSPAQLATMAAAAPYVAARPDWRERQLGREQLRVARQWRRIQVRQARAAQAPRLCEICQDEARGVRRPGRVPCPRCDCRVCAASTWTIRSDASTAPTIRWFWIVAAALALALLNAALGPASMQ